jgi:mgtE-like transporter
MLRSWRAVVARFRALLRSDAAAVRAGFVALLISSGGDLLAGLVLGSITGTLEALPGLLVLVPAAIGMRGNVFGALGSRLGTAIHTGTFQLSRRRDTVVGQNLAAAIAMSLGISLVLAILAKSIAVAFGIENTISVADFVVISVIGGFLSSIVVMGITVGVATLSVRRGWDLDNVSAPIVTAAGDMVTLPALFLATYLVGFQWVTPIIAVICAVVAVAALAASLRSTAPILRRIARESLPVLVLAGTVDVIAGLTIEKRFESFLVYPALLVLVPSFLEDSGALGGILTARIATKLHIGTLEPGRGSLRAVGPDIILIYVYAIPVFFLLGVSADIASWAVGLASPGILEMIAVSMIAGAFATTFAVMIGFYGAIATYRLGLDPDNHGIPIVTSSLDLLGAFALILAIVALGLS